MAPVDDALDRLASIGWLSPQEAQDLATVRQRLAEQDTEIQRLREERDEREAMANRWMRYHGAMQVRAEAAEAENRRWLEWSKGLTTWNPLRALTWIGRKREDNAARPLLAGSEAEPNEGGEA